MNALALLTRYGVAKAAAGGGGAFAPDDLSNLELWLDADDATSITSSGGAVSQWDDKSSNAYAFTQATASLKPTTGSATLNSLNVLAFAGDYLTSTAAAGTCNFLHNGTSHTVFAVVKFGTVADPNAVYALFGTNGTTTAAYGAAVYWDDRATQSRNERLLHGITYNSAGNFVVDNQSSDAFWTPNSHALLTLEADPDNGTAVSRSSFARNGGAAVANNGGAGTPSASNHTRALQIGAAGDGVIPLTGEIAEVIMYSRALTGTEVGNVESYLADKWGLTL